MPRVIDDKPDRKIVKRVSCEHCASKLEYVPNDVQEVRSTDYGGVPDGYKYIVCPKCIKRVILESW